MDEKDDQPVTPTQETEQSTTSSTTSSEEKIPTTNEEMGVVAAQAARSDAATRALVAPDEQKNAVSADARPMSSDPSFRLEILKLAYDATRTPEQVIDAANTYLKWTDNG